ncbi:MAG: hypothetical protein ACI9MB_001711 [Verrucomicrobiales bacterium]|jgi:hypothetical protein
MEVVFWWEITGFRLRKVDLDDDPMIIIAMALIATVFAHC